MSLKILCPSRDACAVALGLALTLPVGAAAQSVPFPVSIQGSSSPLEDVPIHFAAVLPDRPVRVDPQGMSPEANSNQGGPLPVVWEPPMTLVWDFGDGTPPVEVREYTSVSHVWPDDGDYTVTLTVRDERGELASATHDVTVRNRNPRITRSAAVEVDPSARLVELTASAQDAKDDPLVYRWDFGDGETTEGPDLWRVQHRYARAGEYEAVVTFDDGDEGVAVDTVDVVVTGTVVAEEDDPEEPGPAPESVVPGFDASLSGGVSGIFEGRMRSFAGLHLSQISSGACRFMFTAWDDANLAFVMAIMDLRGIPEGGARYTIDGDWLSLILHAEGERYAFQRDRSALGTFNARGLGGMVEALTGGLADLLPDADRARMVDSLGVDPSAPERPDEEARPIPPLSPFGLEEREAFEAAGGSLELTFVPGQYATGTYDVTLANTSSEPPPGLETVRMQGSFALDLAAARREGMIRYEGCGPAELRVVAHHPDPDEEHFYTLEPPVRVRFDRAVDPATLDADHVQISYPDAESGEMVAVPARLLRDPRTVWVMPEEELQPGARYTVRVRAGEEGVLGRDGAKLPDEDGTGWWSFDFETRVELEPEGGAAEALLTCNLFQTARDAPLVPGKPAVARVGAFWKPPEGIHPRAHVTDFEARVFLQAGGGEVASSHHRFVRPDLHDSRGVDRRRAEHTAQLYGFRPDPDAYPAFTVGLEVPTSDGDRAVRYRTRCPSEYWDMAPVVTVDYVAFEVGLWKDDPDELASALPVLRNVAAEAEAYATQLFPLAEIQGGDIRVVPEARGLDFDVSCGSGCFGPAVNEQLRGLSDADIVVGFVPHDLRPEEERGDLWQGLTGGNTSAGLGDGQGVVVSLASPTAEYFPRYVYALVHEWGHVLDLEHLPFVADQAERARVSGLRSGSDPILYRGIEGFRLTPAGDAGWNKSSVEGNEEGAWLTPLMFPATIPAPEAFIANHHYRHVQGLFERLGWSRNAGGP